VEEAEVVEGAGAVAAEEMGYRSSTSSHRGQWSAFHKGV
jgi:hypothetical protein